MKKVICSECKWMVGDGMCVSNVREKNVRYITSCYIRNKEWGQVLR